MIQSLNPATGNLLRSFDALTPDALHAKLALAASAAKTYPKESLDQRTFWMRRLAALLEADLEELAALMTAEMGKTLASARQEVQKCADGCRYYADHAARILAPEPIATEQAAFLANAQCSVHYEPIGIVLAVMPWNFPLWQVFRFAAPALMAGNIALLKHASNVPQCALAIEALIRRAGFPRGCFQTLLVDARQVETILADERIAAVTVTGSEAAGRAIAAQAGWLIKKSVLELGGSDAFIVLSSADLDLAVLNAVKARCINNGQSCIAAKRFLIHTDIYDEFERRFVYAMAALRVGDPTLETTEIGPLATSQVVEELTHQVAAAKAAGGRVLTGGGRASVDDTGPTTGNYFQPTVIAGVHRTAPICKEEIFGPVALLFRIGSLEEAIALANDTPFGLAASAWTTDPLEQQRLAAELQCGAVFFNQTVASDPRLPFGGTKRSGYGRELSTAGMREFLNAKTIVVGGAVSVAESLPAAAPALATQPKVESRHTQPTEFSNFAEQLRKFEPRKSVPPEPAKPEPIKTGPRRIPGGLAPIVFDSVPEPRKMAPIVYDSVPDARKLAPIVLDSDPQPSRKMPKLVYGNESDRDSDDDDNDKPAVRGSILGL
jgi:succinate-semialdehyde dehydrogenase / glutarate-semialdehyde dehydrogenase